MAAGRYESYQYLRVEVVEGVALVTIDRPEALNACRAQDHGEFPRILRDLGDDPDVRAAVVTGAGKAFSVGGDLSLLEQMRSDPTGIPQLMEEGRALVDAHLALSKPIVAAVNGYAMGAGLAFALLCDFIIVERSTRMADGHIRVALAAGDGGAIAWPLTVGLVKAKRYLLTGDWITGEEAERIGLVTEVVDDGTSLERALVIARRMAAGPTQAISYTKVALNQWMRLGMMTSFELSLTGEIAGFTSKAFHSALDDLQASGRTAIPSDDEVAATSPQPGDFRTFA